MSGDCNHCGPVQKPFDRPVVLVIVLVTWCNWRVEARMPLRTYAWRVEERRHDGYTTHVTLRKRHCPTFGQYAVLVEQGLPHRFCPTAVNRTSIRKLF